MNAAYDKFSIKEEEEDGLIFHSEDIATGNAGLTDFRFCLMGRFLIDKVIKLSSYEKYYSGIMASREGSVHQRFITFSFLVPILP